MNLYIGKIVTYRVKLNTDPRGPSQFEDYPAILYRLYPSEHTKEMEFPIGITVFDDGIPRRVAKTLYSSEAAEGRWSEVKS